MSLISNQTCSKLRNERGSRVPKAHDGVGQPKRVGRSRVSCASPGLHTVWIQSFSSKLVATQGYGTHSVLLCLPIAGGKEVDTYIFQGYYKTSECNELD